MSLAAFILLLFFAPSILAIAPPFRRDVDTTYPYMGPAIPIADPVDQTVNGDGTGYPRLWEAPAVEPTLGTLPTNNINVINLAYLDGGMNIHFQTPYGIGGQPCVKWGPERNDLSKSTCGSTATYDRTPPCSDVHVTQCSQFFHDVQLWNLQPATTYYYSIPGGNGTTPSPVLSFTTSREAGDPTAFASDVMVLNDMGYTNAKGTHLQMLAAAGAGAAFAWHGGDISYADDTFYAVSPCNPFNASLPANSTLQQTCYNGSMSTLPGGVDNPDYYIPLPAGEFPAIGSPEGGDMSTMYEPNWDLWQQWMNPITTSVPYMVTPGNHEAACSEGDNTSNNETTAMLELNLKPGSSAPVSNLSYYSCPPSQRNFTAYQYRFHMPGIYSGGSGNFWYSFDYGLAHFISFSGETDYPDSPESPFAADLTGDETKPTEDQTYVTDSGPFGFIKGNISVKENYEQYQWMKNDLANVDRSVTPWVFAMSHRPMYSSQVANSYQPQMRAAWEELFIEYGVDAYLSGHIHWNERMFPLMRNYTLDMGSVINNHTYKTNPGKSLIHLVNGQAGNVESHSELNGAPLLNITAFLDHEHYGFAKLTVHNASMASWQFIHGGNGKVGDYLYIVKTS
ncbi:Metallo-dependent phosphatase-like protein [Mycena maculata]|uniref:Purple acid phosphatase n=1 Tax=Mycena maculata TaxID=230809 RepID=A0AAD7HQB7_9AGAR|nr:Metallo-dependent phosphatase-like protein [Mycena maculata]